MSDHMHTPEPEILTREDTDNGRWDVDHVAPRRGLPVTNIVDRIMRAPGDDTEMSRVIRAHEMMHAKVSPAHDMDAWVERKIASVEALKACEELRVNLLCQKAGFDVQKHLSDDGETADGERIAAGRKLVASPGTLQASKEGRSVLRVREPHRRGVG